MRLPRLFRPIIARINRQSSHNMLLARGWEPTTVPNEYKNANAPGFSVEVGDKGHFVVYRGSRKIEQMEVPPYASYLNQRDK